MKKILFLLASLILFSCVEENKEETFSIDRCVPHKLIAEKSPVTFVEISTFHEDSDSYRVSK